MILGNARTQGEQRRKEAGNVFGGGSRTPISITLLVKNPKANNEKATIHYHDIGDYLSREEKLAIVKKFKSVGNKQMTWKTLQPNEHGDWISQRNDLFSTFIELGDKKKKKEVFFTKYSSGVITNRESWVYDFSQNKLRSRVSSMISYYNEEVKRFKEAISLNPKTQVKDFVSKDEKMIKWDQGLMNDAEKQRTLSVIDANFRVGLYRPFFKQKLYFDQNLNWSRYQLPYLFPKPDSFNLLICVSGSGGTKKFTTVITDSIPDRQLQFNGQCFPLYYYEEREKNSPSLFDSAGESEYIRRDGVSDFILERAKKVYGKNVGKEDIFYYVYGILHSPDYRTAFANDLKKMLPRIPLVEDVRDFWKFSKAGRKLAELHINYEEVTPYEGVKVSGESSGNFKVQKMRFPKKGQQDSIIYNSKRRLIQPSLSCRRL